MNKRLKFCLCIFFAVVFLALVVVCTYLLAERNTIAEIEKAYRQGNADGYADATKENKEETDDLSSLTPWELYKKGYVCYKNGSDKYHLPGCSWLEEGYDIVCEEYALVKGAFACNRCMNGSKYKITAQGK